MYFNDTLTDALPEWSTADANDMDELGTFDASGAFMSTKVQYLPCLMFYNFLIRCII